LLKHIFSEIESREKFKSPLDEYLKVAELLMYTDEKFAQADIRTTSYRVASLMAKFYANRCDMMKMELEIKTASIIDLKSELKKYTQ
jgi:hypothetical protein